MSDPATIRLATFPDALISTKRIRRINILLLGCGVFFCLLAWQYFLKIQHPRNRSAFLRWSNQIQDLRQGINIWEVHEYPNPPIMALILMPFVQLPPVLGAMAWFVFKALLTLLAIHWVWRLSDSWDRSSARRAADENLPSRSQALPGTALPGRLCLPNLPRHTSYSPAQVEAEPLQQRGPRQSLGPRILFSAARPKPFPTWAKFVGLLPALGPIEGDLTHGNVNLFILFLLMAGLYCFVRGRDLEAGTLVGAAIACKLTPLLFLPYFAWKRAWKTLAGCLLSLVLLWSVIPGLVLGFPTNAEFFASWVDKMVLPYVVEGQVTSEHQNQSLPGLAHRLLTHRPSISERVGTAYSPREYHNIADLSPALVSKLMLLVMAGYAVLICYDLPNAVFESTRLAVRGRIQSDHVRDASTERENLEAPLRYLAVAWHRDRVSSGMRIATPDLAALGNSGRGRLADVERRFGPFPRSGPIRRPGSGLRLLYVGSADPAPDHGMVVIAEQSLRS